MVHGFVTQAGRFETLNVVFPPPGPSRPVRHQLPPALAIPPRLPERSTRQSRSPPHHPPGTGITRNALQQSSGDLAKLYRLRRVAPSRGSAPTTLRVAGGTGLGVLLLPH
jgi:hypothetical protein